MSKSNCDPKKPQKKTSMTLPADLYVRLKVYASISGKSQQDVLAEALERFIPKTLTVQSEEDGKYAA